MKDLYDSIFHRKSIRKYDPDHPLSQEELDGVLELANDSQSLIKGIENTFVLTDKRLPNVRFGQASLLCFSQDKENCLLNAGYRLEQVDLQLAQMGIGSCWYGLSRPTRKVAGMVYVIQLAIGRSLENWRKSADEFNRKPIEEIWSGDFDSDVKQAVRLSPSACNSQSWRIESSEGCIRIYRTAAYKTIIPTGMKAYFNTIDLGICLCHLELALARKGFRFSSELASPCEGDPVKIAEYLLH